MFQSNMFYERLTIYFLYLSVYFQYLQVQMIKIHNDHLAVDVI